MEVKEKQGSKGLGFSRTFSLPDEPEVILLNYFKSPYDNIVATARTCYSSKVIYPDDVSATDKAKEIRDKIFTSIFMAGHHTTMQHPTFQFILRKVSRQFVWSFLHSHPFYNSEQVSQRYVPVKKDNFLIPPLEGKPLDIYMETMELQMESYKKLRKLIYRKTKDEYLKIFPARSKDFEEKWEASVKKKVLEVARYVLPVATHSHLYHTISGITLYRYYRLMDYFDTPTETRLVVQKMVDEVSRVDPDFFKNVGQPMKMDETIEYEYLQQFFRKRNITRVNREFDNGLDGHVSKLVDYTANSEDVMCDAFRLSMGISGDEMPDEEAINLLLNPDRNKYLSSRLNILSHTKIAKALNHAYFTFMKKLSHTADSQDQRHRMVPGTRPVLVSNLPLESPDYIVPEVLKHEQEALDHYVGTMEKIWESMNKLSDLGVSSEWIQYLLPNAVSVRMYESGNLMYLHHKWTTRLCYLAQEEIWRACLDETMQIGEKFPLIGKYIGAPCHLRNMAGTKPFCPEGNRFCGVRVWELPLNRFERIL